MNKCIQCGKQTNNPKFCSRSCSVIYNNIKNPKRKKAKRQCPNCGILFPARPSDNQIFCCVGCRQIYRFNNGEAICSPTIRKVLIKLYGNKCSICGVDTTWQNKPLVLIVDHIDGNSDNNMPDNVRLICPNCDSQLPTYKGRNYGNGRYKRRERYQNDQSY